MLQPAATQYHANPNIKSASILSVGRLCDSDFSALSTKKDVTIFNSDKTPVLNGKNNISDGIWDVKLSSSQTASHPTTTTNTNANSVLYLEKRKYELASYLNTTAGCPTKPTFIQAINNGNFTTWPGLTTNLIYKHLPT